MKMNLFGLIVLMILASNCHAQSQYRPSAAEESSLKNFLQNYVGVPSNEVDKEARYSDVFVDLQGNGSQEVIVYLTGSSWCGSGGCTMLILTPEDKSYKIVTKTTVTRLPIRILTTKSNGWFDICVVARINGIEPLYKAMLSFDGKTYPGSPSVPPARKLLKKVPGRVMITDSTEDKPLF